MITEEKIWEYIDGGLNESERRLIADAIASDASVYSLYQEIQSTDSFLKSQVAEIPSFAFADKVMTALPVSIEYRPASKISLMPLIFSALPFIALLLILGYVFALYHSAAPLPSLQINSHIANTIKVLFILADTVLFWLFVEKLWLHNKKQFSL